MEPDLPKQRKAAPSTKLAVSHRLIEETEQGTVKRNGYFYIPNVQF